MVKYSTSAGPSSDAAVSFAAYSGFGAALSCMLCGRFMEAGVGMTITDGAA
jgi:hypothetical protein